MYSSTTCIYGFWMGTAAFGVMTDTIPFYELERWHDGDCFCDVCLLNLAGPSVLVKISDSRLSSDGGHASTNHVTIAFHQVGEMVWRLRPPERKGVIRFCEDGGVDMMNSIFSRSRGHQQGMCRSADLSAAAPSLRRTGWLFSRCLDTCGFSILVTIHGNTAESLA